MPPMRFSELTTAPKIPSTVLVLSMAHRIWKETKQETGTAGPGKMLSFFPFPVGHPEHEHCMSAAASPSESVLTPHRPSVGVE